MINQVDFFKCLSDQTRLNILKLVLNKQNICVCELTEQLELSQPKISRHLALLRTHGVLMDERRGRQWATHYKIQVYGVLGVLLQAKRIGLISCVRPIIQDLQAVDYRLSSSLIETVLRKAGEE